MGRNVEELIKLGDKLFEKKLPLHALWDELALNFYPERADFMSDHTFGAEFASHLTESFPAQARAELSSTLSAMLRPRGRLWALLQTMDDALNRKPANAQWLERQSQIVRAHMYDQRARFVRATREGDNDYVTFGNAVLSVEEAPNRDHLLYRGWHLRDCAWMENDIGVIDHNHRKMKMTARAQQLRWGNKIHKSVKRAAEKEPQKEFQVRHVVLPAEEYDGKVKLPFASIYIDPEHKHLISASGVPVFNYVIPRWHTLSNSVYAFSPSAIIALPDARFAQTLSQILIEAGEKAIDPPAIATEESIRSDINLMSGGITWVDAQYDERLGPPLRYLENKGNFNLGLEYRQDNRETISRSFFLNKLNLPDIDRMTATEVNERIREFVRANLPLFEPMETDYNPQLLDVTFAILANANVIEFDSMPDDLAGMERSFDFESPIQDAEERVHVAQFSELLQLVGAGQEAGATNPADLDVALKDAARGTGGPARWWLTDDQVEARRQQEEEQRRLAEAAAVISEGAGVAGDVAAATQGLQEAGLA